MSLEGKETLLQKTAMRGHRHGEDGCVIRETGGMRLQAKDCWQTSKPEKTGGILPVGVRGVKALLTPRLACWPPEPWQNTWLFTYSTGVY